MEDEVPRIEELVDDVWSANGKISFVLDGTIYDVNLNLKKGYRKRQLPNMRTLRIKKCIGDVEHPSQEYIKTCIASRHKMIKYAIDEDYVRDYVDDLVYKSSDKSNDVKDFLSEEIFEKYYGSWFEDVD